MITKNASERQINVKPRFGRKIRQKVRDKQMSDIELVIKISKEDYERLKEYKKAPFCSLTSRTYETIANGVLLPKGHGDLIDISKLPVTTTYFGINDKPTEVVSYNSILNAKKIIKADKEQEL